jgi:hypothetical protein
MKSSAVKFYYVCYVLILAVLFYHTFRIKGDAKSPVDLFNVYVDVFRKTSLANYC